VIQIPLSQSTELEKGLRQGEDLKVYVKQLEIENQNLLTIIDKDSLIKSNLKLENKRLTDLVVLNTQYAEQDKEQDSFTFKRVLKGDKNRWGISGIAGYGLASNFSLMPIVGLGVSYDLWRF